MIRLPFFLCIILCITLVIACGRDGRMSGNEEDLYGIWAKGPNHGDTLVFLRVNNKNILRYSASFNPGFPAPVETEYYLSGEKLSLKDYWGIGPSQGGAYKIESFKWKQKGQEFEVLGPQIYPFMSAMVTVTFKKVP
jgi:hypothetical protein